MIPGKALCHATQVFSWCMDLRRCWHMHDIYIVIRGERTERANRIETISVSGTEYSAYVPNRIENISYLSVVQLVVLTSQYLGQN